MTEKCNQMTTRFGGIVAGVMVVLSGYLVMKHWEMHRKLQTAQTQLQEIQKAAQAQQFYGSVLKQFAARANKDPKILEILQRDLGGGSATPPPAPAPEPKSSGGTP